MSNEEARLKPPFTLRRDMSPMTRRDWQLYVSAHALALVHAFPDDSWKAYLRKHPDDQLSEQELILRNQKDIIELCGASWILAPIVNNTADASSFSQVREFLTHDIANLFPEDPLKGVRMPRNSTDFSD